MKPIPPSPQVSAMPSGFSSRSNRLSQIWRYISERIRNFIRNINCVKNSEKETPTQATPASRCSNISKVDADMSVKKVTSMPVTKSQSLIQHVQAAVPQEPVFEKLDHNEELDSLDYLVEVVVVPGHLPVLAQVKEASLPVDQKPATRDSPPPVTEL